MLRLIDKAKIQEKIARFYRILKAGFLTKEEVIQTVMLRMGEQVIQKESGVIQRPVGEARQMRVVNGKIFGFLQHAVPALKAGIISDGKEDLCIQVD